MSLGPILPSFAFYVGSGTALNIHICRWECKGIAWQTIINNESLAISIVLNLPRPFSILSKQILMCNPITACRRLPLNQGGGLAFQFQLYYPQIATACEGTPMYCWPGAPGCVPSSCQGCLNVLLCTLISQDPFLPFELGGAKERKRKWSLWSLLKKWFHNSFIEAYSKPFILAPFCSIKGRGEFWEAGNWRQAAVPPALTSAFPGGLQLQFRGRSCYFSWSDSAFKIKLFLLSSPISIEYHRLCFTTDMNECLCTVLSIAMKYIYVYVCVYIYVMGSVIIALLKDDIPLQCNFQVQLLRETLT